MNLLQSVRRFLQKSSRTYWHNNHMHSDSKKRRSFLALHFAAGDVRRSADRRRRTGGWRLWKCGASSKCRKASDEGAADGGPDGAVLARRGWEESWWAVGGTEFASGLALQPPAAAELAAGTDEPPARHLVADSVRPTLLTVSIAVGERYNLNMSSETIRDRILKSLQNLPSDVIKNDPIE